MEQWQGKVALVTGASAGIGVAIVEDLVKSGLTVVGTARRVELIEKQKSHLRCAKGKLIPRQLDVANEKEIMETFQWMEANLGGVDIIVNNAGYMGTTPIPQITMEEIRKGFDTNVVGLTLICREAFRSMKRRGQKNGHIININSVVGHMVPKIPGMSMGVYPATKYAVTANCELLRGEVANLGYRVRVSSISPGLVDTDLINEVRDKLDKLPSLKAEDIAKCVHFVLSMPPTVEITELTVQPQANPAKPRK